MIKGQAPVGLPVNHLGCYLTLTVTQSISGVNHNDKKAPKLKIAQSIITADSKIDNDDQSFFSDQCLPMFMDCPCYSTAVTDSALCPNILKRQGLRDILFAKWSPVGCDKIGR